MRSKPATSQNSRPIRAVLLAALPMALMTAVAGAQTSTSGNVGSATSLNGYPAGGGAIVLPTGDATTATSTVTGAGGTTTTATSTTTSGGGSGGSGGGGRTGTASAGGATTSSGTGGGTHWVLCPPAGSSGLLPLFTGTDLSCTPD
jgi:hypothetical protein